MFKNNILQSIPHELGEKEKIEFEHEAK